jgi:diguanylate cyclase (GGDEF)-like protein/PAS domain S-box-containing protein
MDGSDELAPRIVGLPPLGRERGVILTNLNDNARLALLQAVFLTMEDGVIVLDREFNIILANKRIENRCAPKGPLAGQKCYNALFGRDESCPDCAFLSSIEKGTAQRKVARVLNAKGDADWLELCAYPLPGPDGAVALAIEHIRDITARKQIEEQLRNETVRHQLAFTQSPNGIVVYDLNGKVCEANEQFARMLDYTVEELLQLHIWDLDAQSDEPRLLSLLQRAESICEHFETSYRCKDGSLLEAEVNSSGAILGGKLLVFHVCRDVTELKVIQKRLKETDTHDQSTELYTRRHIFERLAAIAAEYCRDRGDFCIAILDIDDFKAVNSFLGHRAGDLALHELARVLRSAVRPYDLIGRYGGDKFVLVSRNATQAETAAMMDRLVEMVRETDLAPEGNRVRLTLSCGLARSSEFPREGFSLDPMVSLAEKRLNEAKAAGRDRWVGPPNGAALGDGAAQVAADPSPAA